MVTGSNNKRGLLPEQTEEQQVYLFTVQPNKLSLFK